MSGHHRVQLDMQLAPVTCACVSAPSHNISSAPTALSKAQLISEDLTGLFSHRHGCAGAMQRRQPHAARRPPALCVAA
jgi:hypothetical protein